MSRAKNRDDHHSVCQESRNDLQMVISAWQTWIRAARKHFTVCNLFYCFLHHHTIQPTRYIQDTLITQRQKSSIVTHVGPSEQGSAYKRHRSCDYETSDREPTAHGGGSVACWLRGGCA